MSLQFTDFNNFFLDNSFPDVENCRAFLFSRTLTLPIARKSRLTWLERLQLSNFSRGFPNYKIVGDDERRIALGRFFLVHRDFANEKHAGSGQVYGSYVSPAGDGRRPSMGGLARPSALSNQILGLSDRIVLSVSGSGGGVHTFPVQYTKALITKQLSGIRANLSASSHFGTRDALCMDNREAIRKRVGSHTRAGSITMHREQCKFGIRQDQIGTARRNLKILIALSLTVVSPTLTITALGVVCFKDLLYPLSHGLSG